MATHERPNTDLHVERHPADSPSHVTVIMTFEAPPARIDVCQAIWHEAARAARTCSTCRYFTVLREPEYPSRCTIQSEWENLPSFHRFIRESGILWLERAMRHPPVQVKFTCSHSHFPVTEENNVFVAPAVSGRV
jgi:quinol monooxygenase YgiN